MKPLTASLINRHVKFHWGITEFSNYLKVTPEEFTEMFNKTFCGKKRDDLWRKILKNSKPKTNSLPETDSSPETSFVPAEASEGQVVSAPALTEQADLEKQKEQLSMLICSMEENHVALFARRKATFEALANHKTWIASYYDLLKKHSAEVAELSALTYQLSDEMKNLSSEIAKKREELSFIDEKIALLRKVAILAYSNGEIEIENSKEEIPESWQEIYTAILDYEISDELRVRDIKQVAKVLAFAKKLSGAGIFFEVTFENDVAQRLYDAYPI